MFLDRSNTLTQPQIRDNAKISNTLVERTTEDMVAQGILIKTKEAGNGDKFSISDSFNKYWEIVNS